MPPPPLLDPDEPPAAVFENPGGGAPFLLVCDHAGRRFPRRLGTLGLDEAETRRHIAWDIGIAGVGRELSRRLDAPLLLQTYSRLVIDCNRDPTMPSSIPELSETTEIPSNRGLDAAARAARAAAIFHPYHDLLEAELTRHPHCVLVALHSFTPVFKGVARPWHVGVLYHRDSRLARPLLTLLRAEPGLVVGDNQPYAVTDDSDYTMPVHGERRGRLSLEIEIRQDLITEPAGQAEWADRLARLLPATRSAAA